MKRFIVRVLAALVATLLFLHAVLSFGLLGQNEFYWILGVAPVVFLVFGARNALAFAGACFAVSLLLTGLLWATGMERDLFYRPFGVLADYDLMRGLRVFEKNEHLCMTVEKGDLAAQFVEDVALEDPARICYVTDSLGYRNSADFAGQPWVLVGDSYTVTIGVNQTEALTAQVNKQGVGGYNIAYPGNIVDYLRHIRDFKRMRPEADPEYLVFFYEGNDFNRVRDRNRRRTALGRWVLRLREYYRSTILGRFTSVMITRYKARNKKPDVFFRQVAGREVAFFGGHKEVSLRKNYDGGEDFERLFEELAREKVRVFFIPTKYRVYYELLEPDGRPIPHAQWDYLQSLAEKYGVPATDLTGPMQIEARRLAPQGEMLWRASDTHWNGRGTEVGARVVRQAVMAGGE